MNVINTKQLLTEELRELWGSYMDQKDYIVMHIEIHDWEERTGSRQCYSMDEKSIRFDYTATMKSPDNTPEPPAAVTLNRFRTNSIQKYLKRSDNLGELKPIHHAQGQFVQKDIVTDFNFGTD